MLKANTKVNVLLTCMTLAIITPAQAQESTVVSELVQDDEGTNVVRKYKEPRDKLAKLELGSLFFTDDEYMLLREAIEKYRTGPSDDGASGQEIMTTEEKKKTAPRDVSLGGLVFVSGNEWTLWLNKKRVTPSSKPEEILDLKVHKEYVELDWYDIQTNQIFPLRLRPHQRFNLDAKIFLP